MSTLASQIERLTRYAQSIQVAASEIASDPDNLRTATSGPFTRAVLNTCIGDLMRDADASELGLFHVAASHSQSNEPNRAAVERVRFSASTPMRKGKHREVQPEVYAHAALKYIDRYAYIRPMSHTYSQVKEISRRLATLRSSIANLSENLGQAQNAHRLATTKTNAEQEERRIAVIQEQACALRLRKETALEHQRKRYIELPLVQVHEHDMRGTGHQGALSLTPATKLPQSADSLLLDEDMEMGNVSVVSSGSPVPHFSTRGENISYMLPERQHPTSIDSDNETASGRTLEEQGRALRADVISHAALIGASQAATPFERTEKMTAELERIFAKIWATSSDLFTVSPGFSQEKFPSSREILESLANLSTLSPLPLPEASSSAIPPVPTFQQVLTAHLLVSLALADKHSLSMNTCKDLLTAKASEETGNISTQSPIRILYACVGKKLLKIERGSGEQIVRFDI